MIEKIIKANIPVWRPNDYKAETFKDDQPMKKVEKYLGDIKKKMTVVERRKDSGNKKKFGNEAHKRHVKVKQLKNAENKAERQKRIKVTHAKQCIKIEEHNRLSKQIYSHYISNFKGIQILYKYGFK